jgi:GntR family transcriptional regulator, rspAB operon transcriptional repressor
VRTQEQKAYTVLRELILAGDFPAGEFLSQRMLATRSKTTVISTREALRRLETDGLIESIPRWGVRIPEENEQTVRDRYFMREILECAIVRHMAGRWSTAQVERLRELAARCDAIPVGDTAVLSTFCELHLSLHQHIAECVGSRLLTETLARLVTRSFMLRNAKRGWARGARSSNTHHSKLIEALVSGNADIAEKAIREHIRQGLENELENLRGDAS